MSGVFCLRTFYPLLIVSGYFVAVFIKGEGNILVDKCKNYTI